MRFRLAMLLLAGLALGCDNATTPGATSPGTTSPGGATAGATTPATAPGSLPRSTAAPAPARVALHRTGGFAGVDQTVVVDSAGWTYQATQRGQLTTAQRDRLRTLTTDPALRAEAIRGRTPRECADAYEYALTIDALTIRYVDCPPADTEQPVTLAIIDLLVDATPL